MQNPLPGGGAARWIFCSLDGTMVQNEDGPGCDPLPGRHVPQRRRAHQREEVPL